MGPLRLAPYWDWVKSVALTPAVSLPTSLWFWRYPNADPWNSLLPDLLTALIRPPAKLPWRTSNGAMRTWYSFTASIEMGWALAWPPGVPLAASPKTSLFTPPSIWMLLKRLFCPPSVAPGTPAVTTCGTVWMKSVKLRLIVGRRRMAESETNVWAPVRDGESSGFASPVTVMPATSSAARLSEKSWTKVWPRRSVTSVILAGSKPSARTASVYGPPTWAFSKK